MVDRLLGGSHRVSRSRRLTVAMGGVVVVLATMASPAIAAGTISGAGVGSLIVESDDSPITVLDDPRGLAVSPDGTRLFVADFGSNQVSYIDTATNLSLGSVASVSQPIAVAFTPDGTRVYVANAGSTSITEINTANQATTSHPMLFAASAIVVSPDGSRLYVTHPGGPSVGVYSLPTFAPITSVPVGTGPLGIAVTPDGTKLFVSNGSDHTVSIVDTATFVVATVSVGALSFPWGVAVSPDGVTAYVANSGTNVVVPIATATNFIGTPIAVGIAPTALVVSPDGAWLYVANALANTVSVIDTSTGLSVGAPVAVGALSYGIAVSPDGTRIYTANALDDEVTVLNVVELSFVGADEVSPGTTSTTFDVAIDDGNSPIADYSGGAVLAEILNGSNVVVATSTGTYAPNAVTGAVTVTVPTASLPLGTYSVRVTWNDQATAIVATASGFLVTAALAPTGTDGLAFSGVAFALLLAGGGLLWVKRARDRQPRTDRAEL